jgi:hypothetical protein
MNGSGTAVATLQRIQDLWVELARAAIDSPEYRALTKQIHALSAEYRALTHTKKSK